MKARIFYYARAGSQDQDLEGYHQRRHSLLLWPMFKNMISHIDFPDKMFYDRTMYEKTVKKEQYRNDPFRAVNFKRDEEGNLICPNDRTFVFQRIVPEMRFIKGLFSAKHTY